MKSYLTIYRGLPNVFLLLLLCFAGSGVDNPVLAGCCKTFQQKKDPLFLDSYRPHTSPQVLHLSLGFGGFVLGPPSDTVEIGQMFGAIRIPNSWSGVSADYEGQATVTLNGDTLAEINSEDVSHIQSVMDTYGVPYTPPLIKPQWHADAVVAAMAESEEPSGPDYYWVGFSSDSFFVDDIPDSLLPSRVEGTFRIDIEIADAPLTGGTAIVIMGGDDAEGITTVTETVYVDYVYPTLNELGIVVLILLIIASSAFIIYRGRARKSPGVA